MAHAASLDAHPPASRGRATALSALLLGWFGVAAALSARETFVASPGAPPLPLLVAVAGPVLAFLIAYRLSPSVRECALTADIRFVTAMQAWRFGGFAFLALYAYGVLPPFFAWPAGLGDMAIAAAVPWMLAGLGRRPGFASSRTFVAWNVLGIVDLVVAVSVGAVVPLVFRDVAGTELMAAMARFPLALVPAFFVPGYLILHIIALRQAGRAR